MGFAREAEAIFGGLVKWMVVCWSNIMGILVAYQEACCNEGLQGLAEIDKKRWSTGQTSSHSLREGTQLGDLVG